jgi:hypothetical protein
MIRDLRKRRSNSRYSRPSNAMLWGIFGRRGTGKTYLAQTASLWLAVHGRIVLVYDPVANWPNKYRRTLAELDGSDALPRLTAVGDCEPDDLLDRALSIGNCTVICDEFDLLCNPSGWRSESARAIVRRGRHYRVALIATAQRFANIHGDFLALADRISVFQSYHPADVDRIEKALGPEYAERVPKLAPFHWLDWPAGADLTLS